MLRIVPSTQSIREYVMEGRWKGVICPGCGQLAKVYRRHVNSGMARSMIRMYRIGGLDWVHVPTAIPARSREEGKLAYWGLAEEEKTTRPDGGRAGWWRLTPKGEMFIKGEITIPKYVLVYNKEVIKVLDEKTATIKDALGHRFNYEELMSA